MKTWDDAEKLYSEEEIRLSDLRVAIIGEFIKARDENKISQKDFEKLVDAKRPDKFKSEYVDAQLGFMIRQLAPLGKTLTLASINDGE